MIGVAISTTGDEHRMRFLETCVRKWCEIPDVHSLFVTVDGTEETTRRVQALLYQHTGSVYRVGRPSFPGDMDNQHRLGVAANKNTGLELLMNAFNGAGYPQIEHLFLCDDDTWPKSFSALENHMAPDLGAQPHSMVNWGLHRMNATEWTWPRGALLYTQRQVVVAIGGMDERFGIGGHEHVEWSRRIQQAGFTTETFPSPAVYRARGGMGAQAYWHAEDMRRRGEAIGNFKLRRRRLTSIRRPENYWENAEKIMRERDGNPTYVPFRAADNGRASATIPSHSA